MCSGEAGMHLQEGDEVLLRQGVAAGAHEQVDELGRVIVTALEHPGRQRAPQLHPMRGHRPLPRLRGQVLREDGHRRMGPRKGHDGRAGHPRTAVSVPYCPGRRSAGQWRQRHGRTTTPAPGLTFSTWRRTCARRRSPCALHRRRRRAAPSSRAGSRRPAGGRVGDDTGLARPGPPAARASEAAGSAPRAHSPTAQPSACASPRGLQGKGQPLPADTLETLTEMALPSLGHRPPAPTGGVTSAAVQRQRAHPQPWMCSTSDNASGRRKRQRMSGDTRGATRTRL